MRYPGFVGPTARSRSKIACADRTVNLYPEKNDSGSGAPYTLYRVPGFRQWCDLGTSSPIRALYTLNGQTFAIAGGSLYELPYSLGGSATVRATGLQNPDDGPASIIGNGDGGFQLAIAAGSTLYNYDIRTHVLSVIPDIAATQLVFMDGTGFALDSDVSKVYASAPEDFSSWDPLDVYQRENAADRIIAMQRVGPEVWTLGSQTTTVLQEAGAADFPLAPNPSVFVERGILAPWSIVIADGAPIWLGTGNDGSGSIYRANLYSPVAVSTNAVEYALSMYGPMALLDAEAFAYQAEGHLFYLLNLPTANATWVYDVTENVWHERGEWNGLDYDALPIRGHVFANDAHLVGSRTTGVIYEQTLDVATETDGVTPIRWLRRAPHLSDERRRTTYATLQLDAEVGVGLSSSTASEADPQIGLRWSNDGAQTFGNVHYASLGAIGQYDARVIWRRLGFGRNRVFELFGAAPVMTALNDAYLTLRTGAS
jgi:hypothetical protein